MKALNSILLESVVLGPVVLSDPPSTDSDALPRCSFSVGTDPSRPIPVAAYGQTAVSCEQLLSPGSKVRIVGRIAHDIEGSEATGSFRLHVVADYLELVTTRRSEVA